ncbi:hypothetical protein LINPERPRIM_LOCUS5112 [Linum perenne]
MVILSRRTYFWIAIVNLAYQILACISY